MTKRLKSSLSILNRIVFHNEDNIFSNNFYHDEVLLDQGYKFVSKSKPNMFFEAYVKFPENKNQEYDFINYEDYKKLKIKNLFADIENEIREQKQIPDQSFQNLLVEVYDELTGVFKKAVIDNKVNLVEEILKHRDTLKFKYSHIINYHRFYDLHKPLQYLTQGLFKPKEGLKLPFFKDLYYLLADHRMIDSEKTSQENFISTLTSPSPESQIQFTANNYIVVFVLDQLKPFFQSLTTSSIGDSKLFLNKKGKTIISK